VTVIKELYFTEQDLELTAFKMLEEIEDFCKINRNVFIPNRSALLVLDMQKYFLSNNSHAYIPSASVIVSQIVKLVEAYFSANLPVIFTRHMNSSENAGSMSRWWRDLITEDNPLNEIIDELTFPNSLVILKSQYDAFYNTQLEKILHEKNVSQVVLTGVMTHLCCESTARSAFVRGLDVLFAVDGTASYNRKFHTSTLINLAHGFVTPVLVNDILRQIGRDSDD